MPWSCGVTDGAGGARFHDLKTDHAEVDGSDAPAAADLEGQMGSFVVIAITAGSLAGFQASSPPGVLDQL